VSFPKPTDLLSAEDTVRIRTAVAGRSKFLQN